MISVGDKILVANPDRYNYQQIGNVIGIRRYGFTNLGLYCVDFHDASFGVYSEDELEMAKEN